MSQKRKIDEKCHKPLWSHQTLCLTTNPIVISYWTVWNMHICEKINPTSGSNQLFRIIGPYSWLGIASVTLMVNFSTIILWKMCQITRKQSLITWVLIIFSSYLDYVVFFQNVKKVIPTDISCLMFFKLSALRCIKDVARRFYFKMLTCFLYRQIRHFDSI